MTRSRPSAEAPPAGGPPTAIDVMRDVSGALVRAGGCWWSAAMDGARFL